jgi:hypothetical protein
METKERPALTVQITLQQLSSIAIMTTAKYLMVGEATNYDEGGMGIAKQVGL